MSEAQSKLRIGIAGGGPRCLSYVRSLAQIDRAQVVAADPHHPLAHEISRLVPGLALKQDALTLISSSDIDAVLFSEPVGDLFKSNPSRVADALLAITDAKAERSKSNVVKGTYDKLRGSAKKNVEAAVPRLGTMVQKYAVLAV